MLIASRWSGANVALILLGIESFPFLLAWHEGINRNFAPAIHSDSHHSPVSLWEPEFQRGKSEPASFTIQFDQWRATPSKTRLTAKLVSAEKSTTEASRKSPLSSRQTDKAFPVASTFLKLSTRSSIPGTRKLERLEENIGAAAIDLMANDLRDIEAAASKITVQGARYPEHLARMTGL